MLLDAGYKPEIIRNFNHSVVPFQGEVQCDHSLPLVCRARIVLMDATNGECQKKFVQEIVFHKLASWPGRQHTKLCIGCYDMCR